MAEPNQHDADELTKSIILAAVSAAGPVDMMLRKRKDGSEYEAPDLDTWNDRVTMLAGEIVSMIDSPSSGPRRAVEAITRADKRVVGTIINVEKEERSTRGKIAMETKVHPKYAPQGIEYCRTDRTDSSVAAQMLGRKAVKLIGHRVMAHIHMEDTKSGDQVRVVRAITDLGPAKDFSANGAVTATAERRRPDPSGRV